MKKVPIFILKDEEGNTIFTADTLNEAKEYKKFIKENFNTANKKILIRQKVINKPEERSVKPQKNNVIFVIENKNKEIFAKFDSLNEANMFLNRLKTLFGTPIKSLHVRQKVSSKRKNIGIEM